MPTYPVSTENLDLSTDFPNEIEFVDKIGFRSNEILDWTCFI